MDACQYERELDRLEGYVENERTMLRVMEELHELAQTDEQRDILKEEITNHEEALKECEGAVQNFLDDTLIDEEAMEKAHELDGEEEDD